MGIRLELDNSGSNIETRVAGFTGRIRNEQMLCNIAGKFSSK